MPKSVREKDDKSQKKSPWLPQFDRLLIAGIKYGRVVKQDAINKILHLAPQWTRGDCWKRLRYLRKNLARNGADNHGKVKAKASEPRGAATRSSGAPWTPADDDTLFRLAGYEPVPRIAQRLGRSVPAIRNRLGALGMSARVTDGWSLRALRKLLRVGPARLRYLVGSGVLRVRDPRITLSSLKAYCQEKAASIPAVALERTAASIALEEAAFSWERTADLLGVTVAKVQELISDGHLKLVDWFVTDRSFEDFCKKHGSEINFALLDPATAKWLRTEYGVPDVSPSTAQISRAQKHALIIRTCACGKMIAGNPYYRHLRACRAASEAASTQRPNLLDSTNRILRSFQSRSTKESASVRQSAKRG